MTEPTQSNTQERRLRGRPRWEIIADLYTLGLSSRDIGERLNCSAHSIDDALWRMRRTGGYFLPYRHYGEVE